MSFISETRDAFRNDYDDEYESRRTYSRGSYSRYNDYDEPEEYDDAYADDEYSSGWHPIRNFLEKRRLKKEEAEMLAEEEAEMEENSRTRYTEDESQYASGSSKKSRNISKESIRYDRSPLTKGVDIEVAVFYPSTIDEADRIVEAVQNGKIVMFIFEAGEGARNGDAAANGTARRIVDYVGGAAKGMGCGFGRLSNGLFCIAPKNVKLPKDRGRFSY